MNVLRETAPLSRFEKTMWLVLQAIGSYEFMHKFNSDIG